MQGGEAARFRDLVPRRACGCRGPEGRRRSRGERVRAEDRGAARSSGKKLKVLLDLDIGLHRTGVTPGAPAMELAQHIVEVQKAEIELMNQLLAGLSS